MSGDDQIALLNLPELSVAVNLVIIVVMIMVFRLTAFIFVKKNYMPPKFVLPPMKEDLDLEVTIPSPVEKTLQ